MESLNQFIRRTVSPEEYYADVFTDIHWNPGNDEARVLSPFVEEKHPSFSVNKKTGAWYSFCASDEHGGGSIISFHAEFVGLSETEAAEDLYQMYVHPVLKDELIEQWQKNLSTCSSALSYLKYRRLSSKVIRQRQIGWTGTRIAIPIFDEFDLCVNAKLATPLSKERRGKTVKMVNFTRQGESRSFGSPTRIYPIDILIRRQDMLFVCEGEWDCLALLSLGLDAVTPTAGAKAWPDDYTKYFKGKNVVLCFDNDPDGKKGQTRAVRKLMNIAQSVKAIQIPEKIGKDVSDWLRKSDEANHPEFWISKAEKAKPRVENPEVLLLDPDNIVDLSIDQASEAKWHNRMIRVSGLVTGKNLAPYAIPELARVTCSGNCDGCRIVKDGREFVEVEIDKTKPEILDMVNVTKATVRRIILAKAGATKQTGCSGKVEYVKMLNVEHLYIIPTLDSDSREYVVRSAFYVGHGLRSNKAYTFTGISTQDPRDQSVVYLFNSAVPAQDDVETFEITKATCKELHRFRPRNLSPLAYMMDIAEWQSRHVTRIFERPDMHVLIDLAFHSVASFMFNGELVRRGMLDVMVLGDTRCGKGCVTEGLSRYYGLGEIASGDNCTFAGLVGGLQQFGQGWRITWGLIPLNNKRIVIIDEASSLSEKEIARMSRIRSEGIAEIVKIQRESTSAMARLVWLSNPRNGAKIGEFNSGIECLRDLIGAVEDISRFDLVLTVAGNEVPSDIINTVSSDTYDMSDFEKFPRELCRKLILWAWSRTVPQIKFTPEATQLIITNAKRLGKMYSSTIPLIQVENVRIKIAKIAAAVAARCFSTDTTHSMLIIKTKHVQSAVALMNAFYSKPSMNYLAYSETAIASSRISNFDVVRTIIENHATNFDMVLRGLLETYKITSDTLSDFIGDPQTAKSLIGELVQLHALKKSREGNWYIKHSQFTAWLREVRRKG